MIKTAPIVVFDFDLTLTRWDTADRFFRWLIQRDTWRRTAILVALPVLGPLYLLPPLRKWPIRFAVWVATLGRTASDLSPLAEEHIRSLPMGWRSVFVPHAVERLQDHIEQGHRVVIATGCLKPLAQALLRHAGLESVPVVASTLRPFIGGLVRDQHCAGSNKVRMLAAHGFEPPWSSAYTDHRMDLPLLESSAERNLVNPTPKCRAHVEQALAGKTNILIWQ